MLKFNLPIAFLYFIINHSDLDKKQILQNPYVKKVSFVFIIIFSFFNTFAQTSSRHELAFKEVISNSDNIHSEFERALNHFSKDKDKFEACKFLIAYSEYHYFRDKKSFENVNINKLVNIADKEYFNLSKGKTNEHLKSEEFKSTLLSIKNKIESEKNKLLFKSSNINLTEASKSLNAKYLIEQIEHAFWLKDNSVIVRDLEFQDFCEYILPYENTVGLPIRITNKEAFNFFNKYLSKPDYNNLSEIVERYVITLDNFRYILGEYPLKEKIGFEELLFSKVNQWDCFDVSSYGAFVLSSIGIPTAVEYYNGYKTLYGRHSYNRVISDKKKFSSFSLEGAWEELTPKIISQVEKNDGETLNRFRYYYSLQTENPYSLSDENENIPSSFTHPLIKEVTKNIVSHVYEFKIPLSRNTDNKLVYLNTLNTDMINVPMTWGNINKPNNTVVFENVVSDRVYFPVIYNSYGQEESFYNPFMIKPNGTDSTKLDVIHFNNEPLNTVNIKIDILKNASQKLIDRNHHFVGSYVLGADNPRFDNADTLFVLKQALHLGYNYFPINNQKAYKYYRFYQPKGKETKHIEISEIRFLTDNNYAYENTHSIAVDGLDFNENKVRLLEDSIQNLNKRWEYDNKFQTMINYPSLTFPLKVPQVVTGVILAPYIENNINPMVEESSEYSLYEWGDMAWIIKGTKQSKGRKLDFGELKTGSLYLLKKVGGKEKNIPFIVRENGSIYFLYDS